MAIAVRGSRITWVNNASSQAFTFPAGSAAGDMCYVFVGHAWDVSTPSGWTSDDNSVGTFVNGAVFHKVLTAADITAGTVTVNFAGTFQGIVGGITFVGAALFARTQVVSRNSSGAGPRTLTTNSSPQTGDFAVYFSMIRLNSTIAVSRGASIQSVSNTNASGVLYTETLAANGSIAPVFTFGAGPSGDYEVVLVLQEDAGTTPALVHKLSRLTLSSGLGDVKFSQANRMVVSDGRHDLWTPQVVRMVLRSNSTLGTILSQAQLARLVTHSGSGLAYVPQVVRMVVMSSIPAGTGNRRMSLM